MEHVRPGWKCSLLPDNTKDEQHQPYREQSDIARREPREPSRMTPGQMMRPITRNLSFTPFKFPASYQRSPGNISGETLLPRMGNAGDASLSPCQAGRGLPRPSRRLCTHNQRGAWHGSNAKFLSITSESALLF